MGSATRWKSGTGWCSSPAISSLGDCCWFNNLTRSQVRDACSKWGMAGGGRLRPIQLLAVRVSLQAAHRQQAARPKSGAAQKRPGVCQHAGSTQTARPKSGATRKRPGVCQHAGSTQTARPKSGATRKRPGVCQHAGSTQTARPKSGTAQKQPKVVQPKRGAA